MASKPGSNPDFGKRLGERLREMGYWPDGRLLPDYTRFGIEHGYPPSAVYRWLNGELPRADYFLRLCDAVQRRPSYMLWGRDEAATAKAGKRVLRVAKPIAGGSGATESPPAVQVVDMLSLLGPWLRTLLCPAAQPMQVLQYAV